MMEMKIEDDYDDDERSIKICHLLATSSENKCIYKVL